MSIKDLSVITITYNNRYEYLKTYESLGNFRLKGGSHIIINGGQSVADTLNLGHLIEESDKGIYDALNKGISQVNTNYFMLIHSGDCLIESIDELEMLLNRMNDEELDFLLNDCSIQFGKKIRLMKSSNWQPWMFKFGAQPPHPPTIYRTQSVSSILYDINHPVIADFQYLENLFQSNLKWSKGNHLLVHMSAGGATSSGLKSFFHVNKQFRKLKGPFKTAWFSLTRPFLKIYLMIR